MNRALLLGGLLFAAAAGAQEEPSFRRHELALFPFTPQVDAKFTEHRGSALGYRYRLREQVAFELFGQLNWHHAETQFSQDIRENVSQRVITPSSAHQAWMLAAGATVTPLDGDLLVAGRTWRLSGSMSAGGGLAETELTVGTDGEGRAIDLSAGRMPLGYVAVGVRAQPRERISVQLELRRHLLFMKVQTLNGCTGDDLRHADRVIRSTGSVSVSGYSYSSKACNDWLYGLDNPEAVPLAAAFLPAPDSRFPSGPSSDLLNTTHVHAGISVLF